MSFADFPEQKQVVQVLQRSLERNRLAHGYLFTGADVSELEAMARALGKTLNCNSPRRGANNAAIDACDQCDNCKRIDEENHPDFLPVRPESKSRIISVDQMRDLMQTINLKPTIARYKVGVVVCADRLNSNAANAFLKTLEEPPPSSILILLTTEPQRILETILSRCLRLNFSGEKRLRSEEEAWVKSFAQMAADPKGGLLGRYRLLGVLVKKLGEQRTRIDEHLTARSPLEKYDDLDPKVRERMEEELSAAIEAEYRRQRADLLVGVQAWLRDVWLSTMAVPREMLNLPSLADETNTVARRITPADAMNNLQVLEHTQRLLTTNIQEALTLEVSFLKLRL